MQISSCMVQTSTHTVQNKNFYKPTFKATLWKNITTGASIGAGTGAATGAKIGGAIDLGTAGAALGIPTITSTAIGAIGGAITGMAGGYARWAHQNERERLEKERNALEAARVKLAEDIKQKQADMTQADANHKAIIEKQLRILTETARINTLNATYNAKAIDEKNGIGLGRLAGYSDDKKALNEAFISPFIKSRTNPEICEKVPNGILLYGLTGNGKTTMAIALAEQALGIETSLREKDHPNFYNLSSQSPEETVNRLRSIAEKASAEYHQTGQRSIVFIDEFDAISLAPKERGYNAAVNGFLKSFLTGCSDYGITLIATTNHPQSMEDAFIINKERFPVKTALEPPSERDIQDILEYYLKGLTDETVKCNRLAAVLDVKAQKHHEKYTCSTIETIVKEAKKRAKKLSRFVSQDDLISIIKSTSPDLKKKSLDKFKADFEFISGMTYAKYLRIKR